MAHGTATEPEARAGRVPVHVYWQIQHKLMVSGAELAHLYVYDGKTGFLLEQPAEPESWTTIRGGWDAFMEHIRTGSPPPLGDHDTVVRDDEAWAQAARGYIQAKREVDALVEAADAARQQPVALARHSSEQGCGVTVTRYGKQGAVDYKKVPELEGVDVDRYRSAPREEVRVTVAR